jgi:hypothetical protein
MTFELSNPSRRPDAGYSAVATSFIAFVPKLLVVLAVLILVVNGALPQLEMAITGGSSPFMPKPLLLLILGFATMFLLKGRFQSSPLLPLVVVLAVYCSFEAIFLCFVQGLSYAELRSSLDYCFFLFIGVAASVIPLQIKPRRILALLFVIEFACLALSAVQFLTNSPVVPTESSDHTFRVLSYEFFDRSRCFSFFANGLQAGLFYSFMGGLSITFCLRRGTKIFGFVLLALSAFGCYATYTRLTMISFILSAIAVFLMSRKGTAKYTQLLPVFSLFCALLVVVQGLHSSAGEGRNDLANSSSLNQRVLEWGIYTARFLAGSPTDILFGTGQGPYVPFGAPDRPDNASPIPVDNAYLLVPLGSGLLGLVVLGNIYWRLWLFLHKRAIVSKGHLLKGITGIVSTVPFVCSISDPPTQIIAWLLLAVCLTDEDDVASGALPSTLDEGYLRVA